MHVIQPLDAEAVRTLRARIRAPGPVSRIKGGLPGADENKMGQAIDKIAIPKSTGITGNRWGLHDKKDN
jgi:hypothetical protein